MRESKRSTEAKRFFDLWVKGLAWKVRLKIGKLAKKLNDLLSKSIIFDAFINEFASCLAVRNDTVCKKLTARAYSSVGRAADF